MKAVDICAKIMEETASWIAKVLDFLMLFYRSEKYWPLIKQYWIHFVIFY